jgi:crotonobetainyl-CoA:carnitine CoA-transferase CaiB-like acyl-CoA transferase
MIAEFSDSQKGRMKLLASPIRLSETPPDIRRAPSHFGEHTVDVLKELGYEELEIESLKREGVV